MGQDIRIYADHMPLTSLYKLPASPNRQLNKFVGVYSAFGAKIFYRKGKRNAIADALLRIPWDEPPFQPGEEFDPCGFDADDFERVEVLMINTLLLSLKGINIPDLPPEVLSDIQNAQKYDHLGNVLKKVMNGWELPVND